MMSGMAPRLLVVVTCFAALAVAQRSGGSLGAPQPGPIYLTGRISMADESPLPESVNI